MDIREIAKRAKVSTATVSRAINRIPTVDPQLAKRVWKVVDELGYYPNTQARALVSGKSRIFGLIVSEITNPFFPEITKAFQEAASAAGMETIVINTNYDMQRTRNAVDRLVSLQVPGAVFLTSQVDNSIKEALAKRNVSAVYMDHAVAGVPAGNIVIDYEGGIAQAFEHLFKLGHTRIGLIGGPAHGAEGFDRGVAQAVVGYTDALVEHTPMPRAEIERRWKEMIDCARDPHGYALWQVPVWSARKP